MIKFLLLVFAFFSIKAESSTVIGRFSLNTNQVISDATNTRISWAIAQRDTYLGMDTSTGVYTFKKKGDYLLGASAGLGLSANISANNRVALYYKINGGSLKKISGLIFTGAAYETSQWNGTEVLLDMNVGDTIEIIAYVDLSNGSYSLNSVNDAVTYMYLIEMDSAVQAK